MPHFYKGYNKDLDLTEDEWLEQHLYDTYDETEHMDLVVAELEHALEPKIEGEPNEDTYLPGIPDYDIFNRPSWGEEEE